MVDIYAASIGSYPQFHARGQQMGYKGVDIRHARRGIVQLLDLPAPRRYQFKAKGGANGYLPRSHLGDGLHIVHRIVLIFSRKRILVEQVAVQGANP